ncbi:hypothetical protein Glove_116g53 [Diversispora epigaea]|uniref:Uncharacterized protein n=1 Tax=Diversispora epigaea TaxID=1348612 RepID=A0A397JAB1_9GLOM|nr:hypothetical protein Glove_116g53 [Diversispora epigaea]
MTILNGIMSPTTYKSINSDTIQNGILVNNNNNNSIIEDVSVISDNLVVENNNEIAKPVIATNISTIEDGADNEYINRVNEDNENNKNGGMNEDKSGSNKTLIEKIPPSTSLEPMNSFLLLNTHELVTPLDKNSFTCPQCHTPHSVHYVKEVDTENGESKEIFICLSHDNYGCGWKGYDEPNEDKIQAHIAATIGFNPLRLN